MAKSHGKAALVGQHVEQATAHHDGVAYGERLQRSRQKNAAVHFWLDIEVIGDHQVIDHRLQDFVDFSLGSKQTGFFKLLEYVLLRLHLPCALALNRAHVLSGLAVITDGIRVVDQYAGQLFLRHIEFHVVAPEPGLRFEAQLSDHAVFHIRFFAVDVGRQP